MVKRFKLRRILVWACLLTLFAALVWAVGEELLQANKDSQAAAMVGLDEEMAVVQATGTVKPKNNTNIDWTTINRYEKQLQNNTAKYKRLVQQAGMEKQTGQVSPSTKSAGLNSAQEFNSISEKLAAVYRKGNCITKAKTVAAAGQSRLKNADMAFNELSADNISQYNKTRVAMSEANTESLTEDKTTGSQEDLTRLKAMMLPRLQQMITETGRLSMSVLQLLNHVRQIASGNVVAIAGCAKQVLMSGAEGGPVALIRPLMSLLDMLKTMGANLLSTSKLITSL